MQEFLDSLRGLLVDPSGNPAAVGTAIAVVVLFFVILALVLIAFALPKANVPDSGTTDIRPKRRRPLPRWVLLTTGTVALIAGILASLALWYDATSNDRYCSQTCHSMAKAGVTHGASAHSGVKCVRCHEGKPWQNMPEAVVLRGYWLYLEATNAKPRKLRVPVTRCLECHKGIMRLELTARNGEPFRHTDVLTQGPNECKSCHGDQGHARKR